MMPSKKSCCVIEGPTGYIARKAWVSRISKTHKQVKCKKCKLYTQWIPKEEHKENKKQNSPSYKLCKECGKTFIREKGKTLVKYCSQSCRDEYLRKDWNSKYGKGTGYRQKR